MLIDIDDSYVDSIAAELRSQAGNEVSSEVLQAAVKFFAKAGISFMTEERELLYSNVRSFLEGDEQ